MAFELPPLPYDYAALEPHIDEKTMEIHHGKHHQTYVDKPERGARGDRSWEDAPVEELLRDLERCPRTSARGPQPRRRPRQPLPVLDDHEPQRRRRAQGELGDGDRGRFGSFDDFKEKFTRGVGQFGSGWGWVVFSNGGALEADSTPNQDTR